MAKKIVIAEFQIEAKDVYARILELKKLISELTQEQKKLKDSSKENTTEYVKNEVQLKSLNSQLAGQISLGKELVDSKKAQNGIVEAATKAIERESNSIVELRRQNKDLLSIRNQVNLKTKEGQDLLEKINGKIDKNNEYIKSNSTGLEKLKYNVGNYTQSIRDAIYQTGLLGGTFSNIIRQSTQVTSAFGAITLGISAAVAAIGVAIKSSIDLEDKLADVKRTTNLSWKELVLLNRGLTSIDTRSSKSELLSLAEVAGKLGVEGVDNILQFVKSANKITVALGSALGNSEESITSITKIVQILGLDKKMPLADAVLSVGSAISGLGISSTASESYIVDFTKRMASMGIQANFSASQVLALAATFDTIGIGAESGASSLSRFIRSVGSDVAKYAKIANLSTDEFSKLLKEDTIAALIKLLENVKSTGGGVQELTERMKALGVVDVREVEAIAGLTNNLDLLKNALKRSSDEMKNGTSIVGQFESKNETAAAALSKVWNRLGAIMQSSGVAFFIKTVINSIDTLLIGIDKAFTSFNKFLGIKEDPVAKKSPVVNSAVPKLNKNNVINASITENTIKQIEEQKKADSDRVAYLEQQIFKLKALEVESEKYDANRLKAENNRAKTIAKYQKEIISLTEESEKQRAYKIERVDIDLKKSLSTNTKNYTKFIADQKKKEAEYAIAVAKKELDVFIELNKSKIDKNKYFTKEQLDEEIKRLENEANVRKTFEAKKRDAGISSLVEYNISVDAIDAETQKKKDDLAASQDAAEIARATENARIVAEIAALAEGESYGRKIEALDREYRAEISSAEKTGADKALIDRKYALKRIAIEKEHQLTVASMYSEMFGKIATLVGQNTVLGKAAAIAEATIQTYVAAVNAYASAAKIDVTGVFAPTMAALAVAAGLANVAKIAAVDVSGFADGGIISSPQNIPKRSNGDDVLITAKRGEVILNKQQQAAIGVHNLALAKVPGFSIGGVIGESIQSRQANSNESGVYGAISSLIDRVNDTKIVAVVDDINEAIHQKKVLINSARL